jgi:formate hydrogenlyase transcriptional activator
MSEESPTPTSNTQRLEAVLRISEAVLACRDPEALAKVLADELDAVLPFDHLDLLVFKENSRDIEWRSWGKGPWNVPDVPVEELPAWHVFDSQEPLLIVDWKKDERFPRLKQSMATKGIDLGSVLRVPITTPHRRLGTLGISSCAENAYSSEDVDLLRRIARVVAFAIDDALNLRKAHEAQAELQRQNDRLHLLLNLTNKITSYLELREVLRAVAANIRELMQSGGAWIAVPDPASGKLRVFALDYPQGKGIVKEEQLVTPSAAGKEARESLKPVVVSPITLDRVGPTLYEIALARATKSLCFIPLVNRGRALGILGIGRRTELPFMPADVDFLSQVSGPIAIAIENALAYQEISELKDKLAQEKFYLEEEIRSEMNFESIIGNSPALQQVLQLVETVAPSDSTVLLLGETGTGKELIARAIHDHSRRKDRTFVKLNCAAIPTGLLESELFGHEKGAFTGAISQKIGRLELADQGTLFLDEVGDIPIEIQPKLLRALQEREFERLGSTHTRKVNVRLIAATNRDLERMIADREFRSDLYYRLNVFPIRIPPLRKRKEDIPLLVSYFVQKFASQMQKKIDVIAPATMMGLTAWEWPGNVRELENFVERAVILTRGRSLEAPVGELRKTGTNRITNEVQRDRRTVPESIDSRDENRNGVAEERAKKQREEIVRALTACQGRVGGANGAAANLGINRTTLLSRMKKLGISARQYA